jgi:precorrin-6B methylase 2
MSYHAVAGHRSMALDAVRNDAYAAALRQAVGPGSVVLDLGAGTGVLGLIAARAGASRVYLVEPEDVLSVAGEIARANGLQDTVLCLQGRIEEVRLPEKVHVIVSVLTGNFLLTEDLLQPLFYARDTYLEPGGTLVPSEARMQAVPVSAPALHDKDIAGWSAPQHGVDLGCARAYAANTVFYHFEELREAVWLADPVTLCTLDFHTASHTGVQVEVASTVTQSGLCHGWAGWFDMKLGDRWLSTSPRADRLHWSPAFLPLDPPMALEQGETVVFQLARAPFGDWTWTVRAGAGAQQHSTLLAMPMTAASLTRAALDYEPSLNAEGRAVLDVLSRFDGTATVTSLASALSDRYPERYRSTAEAVAFVQRLVRRFA